MRRTSLIVMMVPAVLSLTACTAIVAGELSKTDAYPVTNQLGVDTSSLCSLTGEDASTNACATCIATNCADDVAYACNGADKSTGSSSQLKPWFKNLQNCAENPAEGYVESSYLDWGCSPYTTGDFSSISGTDDSAKERASIMCVHESCILGAGSPCHQCEISIEKPGTNAGYASLDDSQCGQCLRAACAQVIVECCNALPEGFSQCAYPSDPTNKMNCLGAADAGDKKGDAGAGTLDQCAYEVATKCFTSHCIDVCQSGM